MNIPSIYTATQTYTDKTDKAAQAAVKNQETKKAEVTKNTDKIEISGKLSADQLKEIGRQQTESLQRMLSEMLGRQAQSAASANGSVNINKALFSKLTVTPEESAKAAQAISEDGEWGVNAVATRIMDMAQALSGGDSSKAKALRDAVEKGFAAAQAQWGAELPGICGDTKAEINKRFDYWEQNGNMNGYKYSPKAE